MWPVTNAERVGSLSSLSDTETHHADSTSSVKRARLVKSLKPIISANRRVGGTISASPKPLRNRSGNRATQVTGTRFRIPQQDSFMENSENTVLGSLSEITDHQGQKTTAKLLTVGGFPYRANFLTGTITTTDSLHEITISDVRPAEYLALSRLGGNDSFPLVPVAMLISAQHYAHSKMN